MIALSIAIDVAKATAATIAASILLQFSAVQSFPIAVAFIVLALLCATFAGAAIYAAARDIWKSQVPDRTEEEEAAHLAAYRLGHQTGVSDAKAEFAVYTAAWHDDLARVLDPHMTPEMRRDLDSMALDRRPPTE